MMFFWALPHGRLTTARLPASLRRSLFLLRDSVKIFKIQHQLAANSSGTRLKTGNMSRHGRHPTEHVYPFLSNSRNNRSSTSRTNRHICLVRRLRCNISVESFLAIAMGAMLMGAAAVSGSANSRPPPPPPPPPHASAADTNVNSNNSKHNGWGRWVPPPPGPPTDPIAPLEINNHPPGVGNPVGGNGWHVSAGQDDACEAKVGPSGGSTDGAARGSIGSGAGHAADQTDSRFGMGYAGDVHDVSKVEKGYGRGDAGETYDQMMMRQREQEMQMQYDFGQHQQHQRQPQPPPSGSSPPQEIPTPVDQRQVWRDQPFDRENGYGRGDNAYPPTARTTSAISQTDSGMMVGAQERDAGSAAVGAGQWEPPSAASAGAITPEVTLSQYGQVSGQGGGPRTDKTVGGISRALLSNTDKEVIFDGLKKLYRKKILPLEESSRYAHFHSPPMNPADFEAKPMVLIVGQYSVGKTSFIRSLLKRDFPGQRVGPEPTTDRFVAVTHGEDERVMPGHALAMQMDKPFHSLQQFGNNFLTKFEGAVVDAPILRNITLVDTPGVLSGEKQRIGRDYDFASVISWFAERADLIVVMFDAHKLDISDELKIVIDALRPHHDKMRVLLNKADAINTQQLMRVYGALMWSLGKVMQTPEVCRVYIGSFWEAPLNNLDNKSLLEKEKRDLLEELMLLPENAVVRRINELVKRARSVKVHAYIIHYLRKQMPYVMGKQDKQEKLIRRLDQEFLACARRYSLPLGDFPKVEKFRRSLREIKDISKFNRLDKNLVYEMDKVFSIDIPKLMEKAARPGNR